MLTENQHQQAPSAGNVVDGSHISTPVDVPVSDGRRYRVGKCVLTTVYLEDIGLVG